MASFKCILCKAVVTDENPPADVVEYVRRYNTAMKKFRAPQHDPLSKTTVIAELSKQHIIGHADDPE